MLNVTDVWSAKSDEQVIEAVGNLTEYSSQAQSAILSEMNRRRLVLDQTVHIRRTAPTVLECYVRGWKQFAVFRGRSGRKECFSFLLINWAIVVGSLIMMLQVDRTLANALAIPWIAFFVSIQFAQQAMFIRRIHDIGLVGWWVLIELIPVAGGLALIGLMLRNPEAGSNQWG